MDTAKRQLEKQRQLLEMKEILDDMDVRFWLHSGVLLGYYRERNLLPHDPDIDIGVLKKDLPADFTEKLARRLENTDMRLTWKTDSCLKIWKEDDSGAWSHCDIFIHDGDENEAALHLLDSDGVTGVTYKFGLGGGFVPVKFLGTEFLVPRNPKQVVFMQYGPKWSVPKTSWHWAKDPYNLDSRNGLVLDETPTTSVLDKQAEYGKNVLVLGPLTMADAGILSKKCERALIIAEQPEMKIGSVEFRHDDETHCRPEGVFDCAIVPHPDMCNAHNFRTLLENAWAVLEDGGKLVIYGNPPVAVEDLMFEKREDGTYRKYAMHENWEKNVTAIVTTFEAPDLVKGCVESIRKFHPDMRIIVVDNGRNPHPITGARVIPLPYDTGLSASRNAGILHAATPFVFINDDDQHLENSTAIRQMYNSLLRNNLDIVGGNTINTVSGKPARYTGLIHRMPQSIELSSDHHEIFPDGTKLVDLTLNFFVAKTEVCKKIRWTDQLKICEHLDFFLRAQANKIRVGHVDSAKCRHVKNVGARPAQYKNSRGRTEQFRKLMMRLNGVCHIKQFSELQFSYNPGKKNAPLMSGNQITLAAQAVHRIPASPIRAIQGTPNNNKLLVFSPSLRRRIK